MKQFNVRVYGWWYFQGLGVLTSVEKIQGAYYRKFPGGGLEWGEGINECIVREFQEETGVEVAVGKQLYTTDFFQASAFQENHQVISVYLEVKNTLEISKEHAQTIRSLEKDADIEFEWVPLHKLHEDLFPLPIDKEFVKRMKSAV